MQALAPDRVLMVDNSPVELFKGCKNSVEIAGMRSAGIKVSHRVQGMWGTRHAGYKACVGQHMFLLWHVVCPDWAVPQIELRVRRAGYGA